MNSVRNQDAFFYVCANEPCDLLTTAGPESPVFQSHELVWVTFNLVRYGFTGLNDEGRYGTVRACVVAPLSIIDKTNKSQERD